MHPPARDGLQSSREVAPRTRIPVCRRVLGTGRRRLPVRPTFRKARTPCLLVSFALSARAGHGPPTAARETHLSEGPHTLLVSLVRYPVCIAVSRCSTDPGGRIACFDTGPASPLRLGTEGWKRSAGFFLISVRGLLAGTPAERHNVSLPYFLGGWMIPATSPPAAAFAVGAGGTKQPFRQAKKGISPAFPSFRGGFALVHFWLREQPNFSPLPVDTDEEVPE